MTYTTPISFDDTRIAFAQRSDRDLKEMERIFAMMNHSWFVVAGSFLARWALKMHLPVKGLIRKTIFRQFCGGETLEQTGITAAQLGRSAINVILDYGVEGKEGEQSYDHNREEFLRVIRYAATQVHIPFISIKITGFARFSLLEKIHSGKTLNGAEDLEFGRVRERIRSICRTAYEQRIGVLVDAEESWIQQPVDDLTVEMMQEFNRARITVYNTIQLYRHDRLQYLKEFLSILPQTGYMAGLKLVRGAYMEKERKRALQMHYPSPIQQDKETTDLDYNEAVVYCLERLDLLSVFIATHNEASVGVAVNWMARHQTARNHPHVHFSQLYGMSDQISYNLAGAGFNVSKYLPYGPIGEVLPYLIRRAEENTAIGGQVCRELALIRTELIRRQG
jgi:proline dehydrogenase